MAFLYCGDTDQKKAVGAKRNIYPTLCSTGLNPSNGLNFKARFRTYDSPVKSKLNRDFNIYGIVFVIKCFVWSGHSQELALVSLLRIAVAGDHHSFLVAGTEVRREAEVRDIKNPLVSGNCQGVAGQSARGRWLSWCGNEPLLFLQIF